MELSFEEYEESLLYSEDRHLGWSVRSAPLREPRHLEWLALERLLTRVEFVIWASGDVLLLVSNLDDSLYFFRGLFYNNWDYFVR